MSSSSNHPILIKIKSKCKQISRSQTTKNMPKKLQKSLQEYISKIKKQTPHLQFSHRAFSSTTSKILPGCKHPKSLSFTGERKGHKSHHDEHRHNDDVAATLEDIDKFLIENFKSLYGEGSSGKDENGLTNDDDKKGKTKVYHQRVTSDDINLKGVGILFDSPKFFTPPPDLHGSHRFFLSPASSSSLIEEARTNAIETTSKASEEQGSTSASTRDNTAHRRLDDKSSAIPPGIEDCIALLTVSPSPYVDFRRSMQEILDAKINNDQRVNWDFLEELLFCYLKLNEKKQYRYILSAFVDLVVVLRQNSNN